MDARVLRDWRHSCVRPSRGGLAPRRWCQVREAVHGRRWLTSPAHRGDHGVTVKPSRRECRFESGEPVVTTLVCLLFICMRGCGCTWHPAFPAPSFIWAREKFLAYLGRVARRDRGGMFASPLPPAREARGGGGCFSKFASRVTRGDTPTPDPSPQRARARRGRGAEEAFAV
jgi:hypothetical protein